jgi:hypothetical protein
MLVCSLYALDWWAKSWVFLGIHRNHGASAHVLAAIKGSAKKGSHGSQSINQERTI